jgi:hypothetical protein
MMMSCEEDSQGLLRQGRLGKVLSIVSTCFPCFRGGCTGVDATVGGGFFLYLLYDSGNTTMTTAVFYTARLVSCICRLDTFTPLVGLFGIAGWCG